jgi:hypothetical protein
MYKSKFTIDYPKKKPVAINQNHTPMQKQWNDLAFRIKNAEPEIIARACGQDPATNL